LRQCLEPLAGTSGCARKRKPFIPDEEKRANLGITRREFEILELIAQGMNNREIAWKLYVSENNGQDPFQPCFRQIRS
jgi:DNA-binding NarL/FixJ family response regulator